MRVVSRPRPTEPSTEPTTEPGVARSAPGVKQRSPLAGLVTRASWLALGSAATLGLVAWLGLSRGWNWFSTPVTAEDPPAKVDVRSLTIDQIRGASALTTTVFAMEAIVPTSRDRAIGSIRVGSTKLLYIAYGEVRAGIDLSKITRDNVTLTGNRLTIKLPPPELLDRKIDVTRSQVYDYDRGFLGLGPDAAPELVSLAQTQALEKVTEAACQRGLLQEANKRAATVVAQLLGGRASVSGLSNGANPSGSAAAPGSNAGSTKATTTGATVPEVEVVTQEPGQCGLGAIGPGVATTGQVANPGLVNPTSPGLNGANPTGSNPNEPTNGSQPVPSEALPVPQAPPKGQ